MLAPYESYNHRYSWSGLIFTIVLVCFRLVYPHKDVVNVVVMIYIISSWVIALGLNVWEEQRVITYLNHQHRDLTTGGGFGLPLTILDGYWRLFTIANKAVAKGDPIAVWVRDNYQDFLLFHGLLFLSYLIHIILLVLFH